VIVDPGKTSEKLTVATVAARLTSELQKLGFIRVKDRSLKLVKKLNSETEVFLFLGVRRRGVDILVDPVIGVENVKLRERLLRAEWEGSTRVCHIYLGILGSWDRRLYLKTSEELDDVVATVSRSVSEVGLPTMSAYDSLDKVRKLFRDHLMGTKQVPVAVLFVREKLELIQPH
jgi:hypothetical protein